MKERIQKVLSQIGVGSRREVERWITEGRIRVGDDVAQLGDRIDSRDQVFVDGKLIDLKPLDEGQCKVLIYNKPEGEVCTRNDPEGRPTVFDRLPKIKGQRWISVGRLDVNTTGLLLFTTDGELANKLMHPSTGIDREYLCRIHGEVDEPMVKRLHEGVLLEDGMAQFTDIVHGGGEGRNQWFYVCLMEGRNREVRRLWESQGVEVNRLKRVRYGSVFMPSECKVGTWVEMPNKEVNELRSRLGMSKIAFSRRTQQEKLDMGRRKRQQQTTQRRATKKKRFK